MAVTLLAGQDLVAALHQGTLGTPPWGEFLTALKRRTAADHAGLLVRASNGGEQVLGLASGVLEAAFYSEAAVFEYVATRGGIQSLLRVGRTYSEADIAAGSGQKTPNFLHDYMAQHGLKHVRMMRVEEPSGGRLWIVIGRSGEDFSASDAALLRGLSDHLQIALRTWSTLEKERLRAGITGDAIKRLNFGWFLLDPAGRIVDLSDEAEALLQKKAALHRGPKGALVPDKRTAQAALRQYLADVREGPMSSRAIHLSDEPWLDMLLTTPKGTVQRQASGPIVMAFVHGEEPGGGQRSSQLVDLFGLTEKEAQLALMISRGVKIAEAAGTLGLTVETARVYSKRIYAKTGTRGQADLVRLILASIVALS